MINKINRLLARLITKPLNIKDFEKISIILCKSEIQPTLPAIYLKEHLNRVSGAHHLSSIKYEFERLEQKTVKHEPTILYPIGKTKLFRGGLWTSNNSLFTRRLEKFDKLHTVNLKKAVITDSDIAHQYFGHWLSDAVPASLTAESDMPSVIFKKPHYQHANEYTQIFKLQNLVGNLGSVENLFLLEDYSQNSYKVRRYLELRKRLQSNLGLLDNSQSKNVYMARGQTGVKRNLINEKAVIEHLQLRGFDIVYPEKMSVSDLMRKLWNASLVISVEGSALNHCIYSISSKGAYLILQPPHLVNHVHKGICDAMNLHYGFYVCQPTRNLNEFYVDSIPDFDRIIDGLLQKITIS